MITDIDNAKLVSAQGELLPEVQVRCHHCRRLMLKGDDIGEIEFLNQTRTYCSAPECDKAFWKAAKE